MEKEHGKALEGRAFPCFALSFVRFQLKAAANGALRIVMITSFSACGNPDFSCCAGGRTGLSDQIGAGWLSGRGIKNRIYMQLKVNLELLHLTSSARLDKSVSNSKPKGGNPTVQNAFDHLEPFFVSVKSCSFVCCRPARRRFARLDRIILRRYTE